MEKNNDKINGFQFGTISFFLITTLFVGIGITNTFVLNKQDSWLVSITSIILSILPLIILLSIINYEPNKNIFEKMTSLFGKIIGNIINFIFIIFVLFILLAVLKSTTAFANTMYLTKTPSIIIISIFITIAIYGAFKGIETISRLSEILFFMTIIILIIIIISLLPVFHFDELKPILTHGFTPVFKNSFIYMAYSLTPLILITVIPKNNIINNNKYHWKFFLIILIGFFNLFSVFFFTPGIVSSKLAELYRFPAYYVLRKASIGGVINNMENFLSIHWFFNNFILITMSFYFLFEYLKFIFKFRKDIYYKIIIIIIGISLVYLPKLLFKNTFTLTEIMKKYFSLFVSLPIISILIISNVLILFKKIKKLIKNHI